jgi:hypothetical protein
MKYVQITVDGVTYTLQQNSNGQWTVTNRAPYLAGEYPITVIGTTEAGQEIELAVDDYELLQALVLIVTEGNAVSGERMFNYYPRAIQQILEFQALINAEGFEIDFLSGDIDVSVNEAYLSSMSENRVSEWEKLLGITHNNDETLQDRRDTIIARVRGQGKLNTALINSIVGAFTGGTAKSYIKDSVLYVKITPPPENKQYKFNNVVQELSKKVPAHLGISVTRNYATWKEVKENYSNWNAIKQLDSWQDLMIWIAPQ